MPLTKQQLLIPRVLCIGGKEGEPNDTSGNFKSGQIITVGSLVQLGLQLFTASELLLGKLCTDYPNCFKPLPWWYGRTVDEMPQYVKQTGMVDSKDRPVPDVVVKVKKHFSAGNGEWRDDNIRIFCADSYLTGGHGSYNYDDWEPADEADYQEYQKQKQ